MSRFGDCDRCRIIDCLHEGVCPWDCECHYGPHDSYGANDNPKWDDPPEEEDGVDEQID